MTPRRVATYIAGAAAAITMVAVGPGGLAFGAQPNPNDGQNGQRGHNSASTPRGPSAQGGPGAPGDKGQPGKDGSKGSARRSVDGDDGSVVSGRDGAQIAANAQRRAQAAVRRALGQSRKATNAGKHRR